MWLESLEWRWRRYIVFVGSQANQPSQPDTRFSCLCVSCFIFIYIWRYYDEGFISKKAVQNSNSDYIWMDGLTQKVKEEVALGLGYYEITLECAKEVRGLKKISGVTFTIVILWSRLWDCWEEEGGSTTRYKQRAVESSIWWKDLKVAGGRGLNFGRFHLFSAFVANYLCTTGARGKEVRKWKRLASVL